MNNVIMSGNATLVQATAVDADGACRDYLRVVLDVTSSIFEDEDGFYLWFIVHKDLWIDDFAKRRIEITGHMVVHPYTFVLADYIKILD